MKILTALSLLSDTELRDIYRIVKHEKHGVSGYRCRACSIEKEKNRRKKEKFEKKRVKYMEEIVL